MNDKRAADRTGGLEGADDAALGMAAPPEPAPPGAEVDDAEHRVPGATFDQAPVDQAKPWFTSLAAASEQAGVANDAPDEQEPAYPVEDEETS